MNPVVIALPGNEAFAEGITARLGAVRGRLTLRHFPDAETFVQVETPVAGRQVILVCTLDRPDNKMLPLLFVSATVRELGATEIGLVAPYLAYMRQDRRFHDGEGVTSRYFGRLVSGWVDWLVTVDPHLHRYASLAEVYDVPSRVVHAAPLVAAWVRENIEQPLLIGPDSESEQWVADVARRADAPHLVLEKVRRGDRDVEVSVPEVERWRTHTPVLVDDIVSTARTMIATLGHLQRAEMAPAVCIGVHGVFAGTAYEDLVAAGARRIVTCNTIAHPTNAITVVAAVTDAVREIVEP